MDPETIELVVISLLRQGARLAKVSFISTGTWIERKHTEMYFPGTCSTSDLEGISIEKRPKWEKSTSDFRF